MSGLLRTVQAAVLDDREVSLHELLWAMKLQGDLVEAGRTAVSIILMLEAAEREGITARDEEIQQQANRTRCAFGLHEAAATRRWLRSRGLSEEDFEEWMRRDVVIRKLRVAVTRDAIRPRTRPSASINSHSLLTVCLLALTVL